MQIKLNGELREITAHTVAELLREIEAPEQGIAIAINAQVVRRTEFAATTLQDGDVVELIRAVQGG